MIGDFVCGQPGLGADLLGEVVKIAREVLVRHRQFAGPMQAKERRVGFNRQLIKRKMLGCFRDCALELLSPGVGALPRPGIYEIERISWKNRARDRDGVKCFLRVVQAPKLRESGVVERLHAQRNAIDARCAKAAEARCLHAGRIGLQRHFDIRRNTPVLADAIQDRLHR